jgi:hypothetical protein
VLVSSVRLHCSCISLVSVLVAHPLAMATGRFTSMSLKLSGVRLEMNLVNYVRFGSASHIMMMHM